jgi:hypothetical protein
MKKFLKVFVLVIYCPFAVCIVACDSLEEDAAFVGANPPNGSSIASDSVITVTFDNTPMTVDVEIQRHRDTSFWWELDGKTLTVRGNPKFQVGKDYVIIITWTTGRKILNYSVPYPPKPPKLPPVVFVSANPPSGSEIASNASITLTFNNTPADVTVSAGSAIVSGKTVVVTGPFIPGALALTIVWADGSYALDYTVIVP